MDARVDERRFAAHVSIAPSRANARARFARGLDRNATKEVLSEHRLAP